MLRSLKIKILTMYEILRKNWDKSKYFLLSGVIVVFFLLVTVVYKNEDQIKLKSQNYQDSYELTDLKIFKDYLFDQIKSPFININYEIKKGDTIQKILKKYKVKNNEIQNVINQYKKYSSPSQLFVGNKIDIIIEKNATSDNNSILKYNNNIFEIK